MMLPPFWPWPPKAEPLWEHATRRPSLAELPVGEPALMRGLIDCIWADVLREEDPPTPAIH